MGASATGIDVHCHVFNARDLPVPGFILHVLLEEYQGVLDLPLGPFVTMLALIVDLGSRGADAEIAALQEGGERPFAVPAPPRNLRDKAHDAALAMLSSNPDPRSRTVIEQARRLLEQSRPTAASPGAAAPPAAPRRATSEVVGFLADLALLQPGATTDPGPAAAPRRPEHAAPEPTTEQLAAAAAEGAVRHASNRSGPFYFADRIVHPRNELVIALAGLPAKEDAREIALFTPALIDFSYWLDPRAHDSNDPDPTADPADVTPLADQVAVMSRIAALNRSVSGQARHYAIHPFVSFCPWRQLAWEQSRNRSKVSQFDHVRQAIQDAGFIGVKLYPLMGFRPIANAGQPASSYPARLKLLDDWAAGLDRVLTDLYGWCVSNDVPVMAHCSYSQFPSHEAGTLGSPAAWHELLAMPRFRTLRLNLAHCGGVWHLDPQKAQEVIPYTKTLWPADVLRQLAAPDRPPNLYADLADFDGVHLCVKGNTPLGTPTAASALKDVVSHGPRAADRLMYGTDYMFLVLAEHSESYLRSMRECLAPNLGMSPQDLLGGNAARFLGLTDPRSPTRLRLDRFRADKFLARWEKFATA